MAMITFDYNEPQRISHPRSEPSAPQTSKTLSQLQARIQQQQQQQLLMTTTMTVYQTIALLLLLPCVLASNDKAVTGTVKAATTLLNFPGDKLSAEEEAFFDAAWMQAFEQAQAEESSHLMRISKLTIEQETSYRTVVTYPNTRRKNLRALDETTSTGPQAPAQEQEQLHLDTAKSYLEVLLKVDWSCGDESSTCDNENVRRGRRNLAKFRQNDRRFETLLCDTLRATGPSTFVDVQGCNITFFELNVTDDGGI